ncbi:hypothetical protein [Methylobacterium sp. BTF04]|uniref:hypothetical protein n=1 Tax=Methylobacterium sp. BTF04 TaxID=2708300 RepID=UPI001952FF9B|nr:hypothetical protein [Methylobacterium sp. BTF04]
MTDRSIAPHAGLPYRRRSSAEPVAGPRWLRLGLAAVLGTVAGTMLFSTRAEGEAAADRRPRR